LKPSSHATNTNPKSFSLLLALPTDILLIILTYYLPFNTLLSLRSTCHSLHDLLPPSLLTRIRHSIIISHLATETTQLTGYRLAHPRHPYSHLWDLFYSAFEWQLQERPATDLYCYGCLEYLPLRAFVERMSSRGTGLGGSLASHRRCRKCMRRYYRVGGVWWREHWVRKCDTRRRRNRVERWARWVTRGKKLVKVEREDVVGVCATCGVGGEELYWGCVGCFEKEEERRKREFFVDAGLVRGDEEDDEVMVDGNERSGDGEGVTVGSGTTRADRVARWIIERIGEWKDRRDRKKRRKLARRREGGGRWWRRVVRGSVYWEGSWEGRVEALVEYLNGKDVDMETPTKDEWRALDQVPLKKDRRIARCRLCWMPSCIRKATYMAGMASETNLPFEHWCQDCQDEHTEQMKKRNKPMPDANVVHEAIEDLRLLYI
jgi:hypothetical protein